MLKTNKVPLVIGVIVVAGVLCLVLIFRLITESPDELLPISADMPTRTPLPTVIGTPIIGADIASSGGIGFTIMANGISLVVDDVKAYKTTPNNVLIAEGYVFVIVAVRTSNSSQSLVASSAIVLVDRFSNEYKEWGALIEQFGLPQLPGIIEPGQSVVGALIYNVPEAALAQELRLRLEPEQFGFDSPSVRLEIPFTRTLSIEP